MNDWRTSLVIQGCEENAKLKGTQTMKHYHILKSKADERAQTIAVLENSELAEATAKANNARKVLCFSRLCLRK